MYEKGFYNQLIDGETKKGAKKQVKPLIKTTLPAEMYCSAGNENFLVLLKVTSSSVKQA